MNEGDSIEVCAIISSGVSDAVVTVSLFSVDGLAVGKKS